MEKQMDFDVAERKGNLHVKAAGSFTQESAAELITLISSTYNGSGNIFIHTAKITDIDPQSKPMLAALLSVVNLPKGNIYFTGEKGFAICPDHCKVIINGKKGGHACRGNCKNCSCKSKTVH